MTLTTRMHQQQQRHVLVASQKVQVRRPFSATPAAPRRRFPVSTFALKNTPKTPPKQDSDNIFVRVVVAAATETLRLLGVGASSPSPATIPPGYSERPAPGDIGAVLKCLKSDYEERSYFITGVLSDGIYDEDCFFADPTVSFTGRELWKRNLQLLVPFLIEPSIQLTGLQQLEKQKGSDIVKLRADWVLKCGLKLPWTPFVNVVGSTEYDLAYPDNNRIVRHVESWDISAWEALVLVFTPGGRRR